MIFNVSIALKLYTVETYYMSQINLKSLCTTLHTQFNHHKLPVTPFKVRLDMGKNYSDFLIMDFDYISYHLFVQIKSKKCRSYTIQYNIYMYIYINYAYKLKAISRQQKQNLNKWRKKKIIKFQIV